MWPIINDINDEAARLRPLRVALNCGGPDVTMSLSPGWAANVGPVMVL